MSHSEYDDNKSVQVKWDFCPHDQSLERMREVGNQRMADRGSKTVLSGCYPHHPPYICPHFQLLDPLTQSAQHFSRKANTVATKYDHTTLLPQNIHTCHTFGEQRSSYQRQDRRCSQSRIPGGCSSSLKCINMVYRQHRQRFLLINYNAIKCKGSLFFVLSFLKFV